MSNSLTHFDRKGNAHMVDVSSKANTDRVAIAKGTVRMKRETFNIMTEGKAKKGDVLSIARIAGIMGCKKTSELIPLCHPIPLNNVKMNLIPNTGEIGFQCSYRTIGLPVVGIEKLPKSTYAHSELIVNAAMETRPEYHRSFVNML